MLKEICGYSTSLTVTKAENQHWNTLGSNKLEWSCGFTIILSKLQGSLGLFGCLSTIPKGVSKKFSHLMNDSVIKYLHFHCPKLFCYNLKANPFTRYLVRCNKIIDQGQAGEYGRIASISNFFSVALHWPTFQTFITKK